MMEEKDNKGGDRKNHNHEEIYANAVKAGRRTYFFDVRTTRAGDHYLTITESKRRYNEDGTFFYQKHKLFLYKEDFEKFTDALSEAIKKVMELNAERDSNTAEKVENKFSDVKFEDLGTSDNGEAGNEDKAAAEAPAEESPAEEAPASEPPAEEAPAEKASEAPEEKKEELSFEEMTSADLMSDTSTDEGKKDE